MPPKRKPESEATKPTDAGAPVKQQKQVNTNDASFDFVPVKVVSQKSGIIVDEPKRDVQLKVGSKYPQFFRSATGPKDELFTQVVDEENKYREIFAQDRNSPVLNDPHLMLVDVHANSDIFVFEKQPATLPLLFALGDRQKPAGQSCIVDARTFKRNFELFTEYQLRELDWSNVFVAGGTALACLQPIPEPHNKDNIARRNYYHKLAYKTSDVDLFIYGLNEQEANAKLEEVYNAVIQSMPTNAIAFRSTHAITIISEFPYRHIQIVLRLYKSPAEILMGFDVDACSVGFDGDKVWMTPRCHRAMTHQYNVVDMSRRSPSYEMRLAKYGERGFAVLLPSLDRKKIDPQLFERRFDQLQGLARLLLLESLTTAESRTKYKDQQRLRKLRPSASSSQPFWSNLDPQFQDEFSRERLEAAGGADASDYSTLFLPWGPKWTAVRIRKMMYTKDMILNSKWYDPTKKHHTHPCFFGTISEIVHDCCGHCPPVEKKEDQAVIDDMFVQGELKWVTVNPGSQNARIGSFHPITEGDWTEGAYVSPIVEKMCIAVSQNDLVTIRTCLEEGANINATDPVGRTPLIIASFVGAEAAARYLIVNGARISSKTSDGRTAMHVAAQYGHVGIVRLLLERGKVLALELAALKPADKKGEKKPAAKKSGGGKPMKKKVSKMDVEDEDDEGDEDEDDGDMDEDDGGDEDEDDEGDEDEDGGDDDEGDGDEDGEDGEFESIKSLLEAKKRARQQEDEEADPSLKLDEEHDRLDLDATEWDYKLTPLHFAAFFGHTTVVKELLATDFPFDKMRMLQYMCPNNKTEIVKTYSLLSLALLSQRLDTFNALLKLLPQLINQLDKQHENILHKACRMLHLDAIVSIVEYQGKDKVNLNALSKEWQTPLQLAIAGGKGKVVKNPGYWNNNDSDDDDDDDYDSSSDDDSENDMKAEKKSEEEFDEKKYTEKFLKDPCSANQFEVVEYLLSVGCLAHITEALMPSQSQQQQFGFKAGKANKWGGNNQGQAQSERSNLRNTVTQPIFSIVSGTPSPKLLKLIIKKCQVNWINPQKQTATTVIEAYLEGLKKQIEDEKNTYEKFLKDNLPKDVNGALYFELMVEYVGRDSGHRHRRFNQPEEDDSASAHRKKVLLRRFQITLAKDCLNILKSAGGKPFLALKLTGTPDADLVEEQKQMKINLEQQKAMQANGGAFAGGFGGFGGGFGGRKVNKKSKVKKGANGEDEYELPVLEYNNINVANQKTEYYSRPSSKPHAAEQQADYRKLHEMVWKGESDKIKSLTTAKPVGKQLHIATCTSLSKFSFLMLAMMQNNAKMVKEIMTIAKAQYTPIPFLEPDAKDQQKAKALNNYQLISFMENIRPGDYLVDGMPVQNVKNIDPNAKPVQLNCTTTLASYLQYSCGDYSSYQNLNVLHVAAKYGAAAAARALLEFIVVEKVKPNRHLDDDGGGLGVANPMKGKESFLSQLFQEKSKDGMTCFEMAILAGHTDVARLFLEYGCISNTEKVVEDEYKGLDVGGKKMDWALEHQAPQVKKSTVTALHLAAGYNKAESARFLLTECEALWRKASGGSSTAKVPGHFDIAATDKHLNTIFHVAACKRSNGDVLRYLLSVDKDRVSEKGNKGGLTPLMLASARGHLALVKIFLDSNVAIDAVDERGWTALHFAASYDHADCVRALLGKSTRAQANVFSKGFSQNPFIIAAHYGSKKALTAMIKSGLYDEHVTDACGETALHHALKHGQKEVVTLLLSSPKGAQSVMDESGIGLNALDYTNMVLMKPFAAHRKNNNQTKDQRPSDTQIEIFNNVLKISSQGGARRLAHLGDVSRASEIMREASLKEALASVAAQLANPYGRHKSTLKYDCHNNDVYDLAGDYDERKELNKELKLVVPEEEMEVEDEKEPEKEESSSSSEEEVKKGGGNPTSLKGMTIALSGTLSIKRDTVISIIKKNGGNYAASITKACTHLIVGDVNDTTAKITNAKAAGVQVVGEDFLENFM